MRPRYGNYDDEPVIPGFERVARRAGQEAEQVIDLDFEVSPLNQALTDDNGGEWL